MLSEILGEKSHINSLGQSFIRIEAGTFQMGNRHAPSGNFGSRDGGKDERGEWDEYPLHNVTLSKPFFMSDTQVTNAQYEMFDPDHKELRGKGGVSHGDDDAVVFVSWEDAVRYCEWVSKKDGLPYRLPTEAEWEYACRAGTDTLYNLGDELPEGFQKVNPDLGPIFFIHWFKENEMPKEYKIDCSLSTALRQTPANAWGLYDMHGNVEEWCLDWFGPYEDGAQFDPVGPVSGDCRITRGGSHSQFVKLLTSANRGGNVPWARTPTVGFRVVIGDLPDSKKTPVQIPATQLGVSQTPASQNAVKYISEPVFIEPRPYVKIPADSCGPLYSAHNHQPTIVECPNGDLLSVVHNNQRTWH